jgi:hypothetical protein
MRTVSTRLQDKWIAFIHQHSLPWAPSSVRGEPHTHITHGEGEESRAPPKTEAGLHLARRLYCDRDAVREEVRSACKAPAPSNVSRPIRARGALPNVLWRSW